MPSYSLDEIQAMAAAEAGGQPMQRGPAVFSLDDVKAMQAQEKEDLARRQITGSIPYAILRGGKDVIDTGAELLAKGWDKLTGGDQPTLSSLVTGQPQGEYARVKAMNDAGKAEYERDAQGRIGPQIGRLGGNLLMGGPFVRAAGATLGATGVPFLQATGNAVASGGMTTGRTLAPAADMTARIVGGGTGGYISAGLADPDSANTGAVIGAVLPPGLNVVGKGFHAAGNALRGPGVPEGVRRSVAQAQEAGYVIPPTQGNPTLLNRTLEGMAGKLTTAQQASARNQPVTNDLARRSVGATELTPEALQAVRNQANQAYEALGQVGAFQVDDGFRAAVNRAAGNSSQMKQDFPGLVNRDIEALAESLVSREQFGAQPTIEAIKRLRFEGSANKGAQDPAKVGLGRTQMKIAEALEDLIDRNLQAAGSRDLLTSYRDARTTLAKVYDVEKTLNTSTGNVDAQKVAKLFAKGRPLTGELKTIAEFAQAFPKAAQPTERMGSLPGVSPLDFATFGAISGASGSPGFMSGLLLRPAARNLALSPTIQRGLLAQQQAPANAGLLGQLGDDLLSQGFFQTAPLLGVSR